MLAQGNGKVKKRNYLDNVKLQLIYLAVFASEIYGRWEKDTLIQWISSHGQRCPRPDGTDNSSLEERPAWSNDR
ncbi:MAG: hypothetical protein Fur0043_21940 [Anaerolineales bacterium]